MISSSVGVKGTSVSVFPKPKNSLRVPTTGDISYPLGYKWIYENGTSSVTYELISKVAGSANWVSYAISGSSATFTELKVTESFYADMSGTATSTFTIETGLASDDAILFDSTTAGGGLNLLTAGNLTVGSASGTAAAAAITLNAKVGVATLTGLTTAAAATETLTITNDQVSEGSGILVTVSNLGAAKITVEQVKTAAGSFVVEVKNNGAGALDNNLIVSWMILF